MPIVRLKDADAYDKAVAVLLRYGGSFSGRDPQMLLVNPDQFQALVKEGLVKPPCQRNRNGQKKAKAQS